MMESDLGVRHCLRMMVLGAFFVGVGVQANPWRVYLSQDKTPGLPRVMMVGDSICNGYRGTVGKELKGEAIVDVWLTPLHIAHQGLLPALKKAFGDREYDVITFNHGLHGFGNRIPQGKYSELLEAYVIELKKLAGDATLIWVNTTPVNAKGDNAVLDSERNPVVEKRNAMAAEIMKRHGIQIIDLYSLVVNKPELRAKPADQYHYNSKGRTVQGKLIASVLKNVLAERKPTKGN